MKLSSFVIFCLLLIQTDIAFAADKVTQEHSFLGRAETWVAVSFFFFLAAFYKPIKKMLFSKLDGRSEAIRSELEEAQRLREEAQHTLAEYERKQRDALKEAENLISEAKAEAERLQKAASDRTEELLKRREQHALDMISAAEAQAINDVRELAAEVAISAASKLLNTAAAKDTGDILIDRAIKDISSKLN